MASRLARWSALLLAATGILAGARAVAPAPAAACSAQVADIGQGFGVESFTSRYRSAVSSRTGWFQNGQAADIMLSGFDFDDAGGPLAFNHPGGIATDGVRLVLADRNDNRVLVWSTLPDSGDAAPDLVLGQPDFRSNGPGRSLAQMNWPTSVTTDGTHLVVSDTLNDRLLVWRRFPTRSQQRADFALTDGVVWPWAVGTDGQRLIATSTGRQTVMIWDRFPDSARSPDLNVTLSSFGTPRTIGSDGQRLVISDHNARPNQGNSGTFFWRSFPVRPDQAYDFFLASPVGDPNGSVLWGPTFLSDGRFAALGNKQLYLWSRFPESDRDLPELAIGTGGPNDDLCGLQFDAGDSSGLAHAGTRLYASLDNGNRVVAYRTLPRTAQSLPDFALGSRDVYTNPHEARHVITNGVPVTDGRSLAIVSGYDRRMSVWRALPDESGAAPDLVFHFPSAGGEMLGAVFHEGRLLVGGGDRIYVWDGIPTEARAPSRTLVSPIGGVSFRRISGVAADADYVYVGDRDLNRVYAFRGLPETPAAPAIALAVTRPGRLSSDGRYLAIPSVTSAELGGGVQLYDVATLASGAPPALIGGAGSPIRLNLPEATLVAGEALFVADTPFSRVVAWRRAADAYAQRPPDLVLGERDFQDTIPEIGRDKLFWPGGLAFDGTHLWVGEYKFSNRVLRFTVR